MSPAGESVRLRARQLGQGSLLASGPVCTGAPSSRGSRRGVSGGGCHKGSWPHAQPSAEGQVWRVSQGPSRPCSLAAEAAVPSTGAAAWAPKASWAAPRVRRPGNAAGTRGRRRRRAQSRLCRAGEEVSTKHGGLGGPSGEQRPRLVPVRCAPAPPALEAQCHPLAGFPCTALSQRDVHLRHGAGLGRPSSIRRATVQIWGLFHQRKR